jgi:hypothetical protein
MFVSKFIMAGESLKRRADREDGQRNVRSKLHVNPFGNVILTNMEPTKLDLCWS